MVPTIERRLTPIKNIYLDNVKAPNVKFISKISAQKELPVENVFLKNVNADVVKENQNIHENVVNFVNKN